MTSIDESRRSFMKRAGGSLIAAAAVRASPFQRCLRMQPIPPSPKLGRPRVQRRRKKRCKCLKKATPGSCRGKCLQRDLMQQVKATGGGQFPFAAIVGCIDSRASNELIFDQGIGDIFSARVAGNFVNDDILGSLEFAWPQRERSWSSF